MTDLTPSDLRTRLAAAFDARGWEYDLVTGKAVAERTERDGRIDPAALASAVPNSFLQRTGATRDEVEAVIEHVAGGRVLRAEERTPATLVVNDNRHQLNLGQGAQIVNSQVNVSGKQINIRADSSKDDVMAGVAELVRAGLNDGWDPAAARDLAEVVDARDDVASADIEAVVREVAAEEAAEPGRARRMIESITEQGFGGALAVGIVKALTLLVALA